MALDVMQPWLNLRLGLVQVLVLDLKIASGMMNLEEYSVADPLQPLTLALRLLSNSSLDLKSWLKMASDMVDLK